MRVTQRDFGAYYTPTEVAEYLTRWAMALEPRDVLEPSFGEGAFLAAGRTQGSEATWLGYELDAQAVSTAVSNDLIGQNEAINGDFLGCPNPLVDAAVGNPPFVRVRHLPAPEARSARAAYREAVGEDFDPSGSVWAPFVAKCTGSLRPTGALAFVLPWEMTYVRYARALWRYLGASFSSIRTLRIKERLFPKLSQDVILFMASGKGGSTEAIDFETYESFVDVERERPATRATISLSAVVAGEREFQRCLIPQEIRESVLLTLREHSQPISALAKFHIGYVSGHKSFFHPSHEQIERFSLPTSSLINAIIDARGMKGVGLRTSDIPSHDQLWMPIEPTAADEAYRREGMARKVHEAYKCKIRDPWHIVPGVKSPDVIVSVFADTPLLMINDSGAAASNSLICGYLRPNQRADVLAAHWYSAIARLSMELEVHSLGGGVLVLIPGEADRLLVPKSILTSGLDSVDQLVRDGQLAAAYHSADTQLRMMIGSEGLGQLWEAIEALEGWRKRTT